MTRSASHARGPVVLDASVYLSHVTGDANAAKGGHLVAAATGAGIFVPRLYWYEARNGLRKAELNQRLSTTEVDSLLAMLGDYPIRYDDPPDDAAVMTLSRARKLKFNDACYLDLALRLNLRLSSFDRSLRRAAGEAGVPLFDGADNHA